MSRTDAQGGLARAPGLTDLFNLPVSAGTLRLDTRNQDSPAAGEGKIRDYPRPLQVAFREWWIGGSASLHHAVSEHAANRFLPGKGSSFSDSFITTKRLHLSR